jgi:hypothetical protein
VFNGVVGVVEHGSCDFTCLFELFEKLLLDLAMGLGTSAAIISGRISRLKLDIIFQKYVEDRINLGIRGFAFASRSSVPRAGGHIIYIL